MHHSEHNGLTEEEHWIVEELVKYGTEDTNHLTNYCLNDNIIWVKRLASVLKNYSILVCLIMQKMQDGQ